MVSKKGKPKNQLNNSRGDMSQDERLQAVVLTDSFEKRFMPLTMVKPRCLLPLANIPLIEYNLEFLTKAGVSEVYLICTSHSDQIQEYIENSKWSQPRSPFKICVITSLESRSVGDVMRDIDNRGLITGDFILLSGDLVTNIEFDKALETHRKKRTDDKDHIVTMCLSKTSQYHRSRSHQPSTFILDKFNRCLYYQEIPSASSKKKTSIEIDPELLEGIDEFSLRNDLTDCCIDICSPHVPAIFQENFDYQYLRRDFVKGVLSSDLLKKHIYVYITEEYAARAESWQTYDAISQDFIARWCYPLALNSNILEDHTYSYESKHIYKEKDVILAQSCKIGKCTVIGSNSKIGEGTFIKNSVIGRNCQIGENIIITNSYIWDNTVIMDNSNIDHSIVASGAKIGKGVTLNDGCIIGFNVVIDESMNIPPGSKISAIPIMETLQLSDTGSYIYSDEDEDDTKEKRERYRESKVTIAIDVVGEHGVGYIYESDFSDDDDDTTDGDNITNVLSYKLDELYLSDCSISSTTPKSKKKRTLSTTSLYTDKEDDMDEADDNFENEAIATVERAMENNHDLDTALLELNTLRMSLNVTYHEVRAATAKSMLQRVYHFIETQTLGSKDAVIKVFSQWGSLFKRQAFDQEEYIDLINILMEYIITQKFDRSDFILFSVLNCLYDNDILEEEVIHEWWESTSNNSKYDEVKTLTAKWVEWLKNADEESDDESSKTSDE